jgi:hypothetical protein
VDVPDCGLQVFELFVTVWTHPERDGETAESRAKQAPRRVNLFIDITEDVFFSKLRSEVAQPEGFEDLLEFGLELSLSSRPMTAIADASSLMAT